MGPSEYIKFFRQWNVVTLFWMRLSRLKRKGKAKGKLRGSQFRVTVESVLKFLWQIIGNDVSHKWFGGVLEGGSFGGDVGRSFFLWKSIWTDVVWNHWQKVKRKKDEVENFKVDNVGIEPSRHPFLPNQVRFYFQVYFCNNSSRLFSITSTSVSRQSPISSPNIIDDCPQNVNK